ncbi:MAG: hypothetical protein HY075_01675 [Deltaproteobacteria bacterium]|nr:hypothetical protein [Deltaproteobacteria bacterium]
MSDLQDLRSKLKDNAVGAAGALGGRCQRRQALDTTTLKLGATHPAAVDVLKTVDTASLHLSSLIELRRSYASNLIAALRASLPQKPGDELASLDTDFPITLFPVRLETRFVQGAAANGAPSFELRIRVFPDEISANGHVAVLSDDEIAWAKAYWSDFKAAQTAAAQAKSAPPDDHDAWNRLLQRVAAPRAAYLVSMVTPNSDGSFSVATPAQGGSLPGAYEARTLPDRWLAVLTTNAGDTLPPVAGSPVREPLCLNLNVKAPAKDGQGVKGIPVDDDAVWAYDYTKALEAGMAITVPLTQLQYTAGFKRLLVFGVKASANPTDAGKMIEELLLANHFTRGVAFVPQGTPTNNTGDESSGHPFSDFSDPATFPVERKKLGLVDMNDGVFFARALGLSRELAGRIHNADQYEQRWAKSMNIALWPATLRYFFEQMLRDASNEAPDDDTAPNPYRFVFDRIALKPNLLDGGVGDVGIGTGKGIGKPPITGIPGGGVKVATAVARSADRFLTQLADDGNRHALENYFVNYVRPKGHSPALCVGTLPYAVLPTTSLQLWQAQSVDQPTAPPSFADAAVPAALRSFRSHWLAAAEKAPRVGGTGNPDAALVGVLGLDASAQEVLLRNSLGGYAASHAGQSVYNLPAITKILKELSGNRGVWLQKIGQASWAPFVSNLNFASTVTRFAPPLVADKSLEDLSLADIGDAYISGSILGATFPLSYDPTPLRADKKPWPLLYYVLRHSTLSLIDRLAFEIQVARGQVDPGLRREPEIYSTDDAAAFTATFRINQLAAEASTVLKPLKPLTIEMLLGYLDRVLDGVKLSSNGSYHSQDSTLFDIVEGADPKSSTGIDSPKYMQRYVAALKTLESVPTAELGRLFGETLDVCSHRIDPWFGSLAAKRLSDMRRKLSKRPNAAPAGGDSFASGTHLGGFGWVEDLKPTPPASGTVGGFMHGPSLEHAAAAAILRNNYITRPTNGADLSSARVRRALYLLDCVRSGERLGAVLGHLLEKSMHDVDDVALFIEPLRAAFPMSDPGVVPGGSAAAAPRNVIDGMKFLETWRTWQENPSHPAPYPFGADKLDPNDPALSAAWASRLGSNASMDKVIRDLDDALDALTDGWAGDLLGDPASVSFALSYKASPAAAAQLSPAMSLASLRLRPLDFLALAAHCDPASPAGSDLDLLCRACASAQGLLPAGAVEVSTVFDGDKRAGRNLRELVALARSVNELVSKSRPLRKEDLMTAGAQVPPVDEKAHTDFVQPLIRQCLANVTVAQAGMGPADGAFSLQRNLACFGVTEVVREGATLAAVKAAIDARSAEFDSAITRGYALGAKALLGDDFVLLPKFSFATGEAPPASVAVGANAVKKWFHLTVRARDSLGSLRRMSLAAEALGQPLGFSGLDTDTGRPRYSVLQSPAPAVAGAWAGLAGDADSIVPGTISLVLLSRDADASDTDWYGLLVDEWPELVPSKREKTGVSFHHPSPKSRAPQAILVAVPPNVAAKKWDLATLQAVLQETLDFAKMRAVDTDLLGDFSQSIPALYLGANAAGAVVSTRLDGCSTPVDPKELSGRGN